MLMVMRSAVLCRSAKLCKPCSAPIDCSFCRNSALTAFIVLFGNVSRAIATVRPIEIQVFRKHASVLCTSAEARYHALLAIEKVYFCISTPLLLL